MSLLLFILYKLLKKCRLQCYNKERSVLEQFQPLERKSYLKSYLVFCVKNSSSLVNPHHFVVVERVVFHQYSQEDNFGVLGESRARTETAGSSEGECDCSLLSCPEHILWDSVLLSLFIHSSFWEYLSKGL